MAEREQTRPLAVAAGTYRVSSYEDVDAAISKDLLRRHRSHRCLKLCGCSIAALLFLTVVAIILAFTVFRVKDPKITLNSVSVGQLQLSGFGFGFGSGAPSPRLNLTLVADVSVKNPNAASFRFRNATTEISYSGVAVGEARTPAGLARARRTLRMNATVEVDSARILGVQGLLQDVISGSLTVRSVTKVPGRVKILGVFRRHADVSMDCNVTLNVGSRSVQRLKCHRSVSM